MDLVKLHDLMEAVVPRGLRVIRISLNLHYSSMNLIWEFSLREGEEDGTIINQPVSFDDALIGVREACSRAGSIMYRYRMANTERMR